MKPTKPKPSRGSGTDGPVRAFKDATAWEAWLEKNQSAAGGLWIRIAKKASGRKSITHPEALEIALCYGWIDGLRRPENGTTFLQRFVPRRPRSLWSKINRDKALALIAAGRMKPAGLKEVERARQDGRWDAAYDSQKNAAIQPDFQKALDKNPRASEFFKTLSAGNRYAVLWRIQTARKPETRTERIRTFVEMLEKGKTLH
jgi:uncharacterized protein YdeI (YjbR/CyaY-like superfamily)